MNKVAHPFSPSLKDGRVASGGAIGSCLAAGFFGFVACVHAANDKAVGVVRTVFGVEV